MVTRPASPGRIDVTGSHRDREAPVCALCRVQSCEQEPPVRHPSNCPMVNRVEVLEEAARTYFNDPLTGRIVAESARTEAAGYCELTRVEEIMDFARRMGWTRLGIAHCIALAHEAKLARDIFVAGGFEVVTVCCKVGSIPKESLGLTDDEKVHPGGFEATCNPVAQAKILADAGAQLNVMIGLCVGHDSMFFMHSTVPVTVLVVKDRVMGHNPVAVLYTSHSYYRRLTTSTAGPGVTSDGSAEPTPAAPSSSPAAAGTS